MSNKIVVVGSANTDLVIHSPKMPKLGETLTGSNFQVNAGGKGLNQAVAIAKLGGDVAFLGGIGNDGNGDVLREALNQNGIAFTGVDTAEAPTGIAMITIVDGNNFIILNAGANEKLTPAAVERHKDMIADAQYCVMQLEIPMETVLKVCEIAESANTKIVLNPAPFQELPAKLLSKIDYLIPNEHEAEDLTGICVDTEENCRKAMAKLKQMGVKNVIITLGGRGCAYSNGDDVVFCPALKTTVVDTTSAGDCFIGALVSKLSQNETIEAAVAFATKASAIAVSREGAAKSIPLANEIV